jgi:hypothetical protein
VELRQDRQMGAEGELNERSSGHERSSEVDRTDEQYYSGMDLTNEQYNGIDQTNEHEYSGIDLTNEQYSGIDLTAISALVDGMVRDVPRNHSTQRL